ncbi:MAG: hypothetical protein IMF09_02445 [Proteobacteria bacterium]|nr:hypothetical protein [Pseudomonadota bacterium]
MTILFCTGTQYIDWPQVAEQCLSQTIWGTELQQALTAFNLEMSPGQLTGEEALSWKAFSPDKSFHETANTLLSSVEGKTFFVWADKTLSLNLEFWSSTVNSAKFLLFFCSPEAELGAYLAAHPFDEIELDKVLSAWVIRTQAMLGFYMNYRDRCLLVNVESAASESELFVQEINQRFDYNLPPNPPVTAFRNKKTTLVEYLATTLLLKNYRVLELYDEVRSASQLIGTQDNLILGIDDRSQLLIKGFLAEVAVYKQLADKQAGLEEQLFHNKLQINQMQEELEQYFKKSVEQEKITSTMADYLSNDPLLKIARKARRRQ